MKKKKSSMTGTDLRALRERTFNKATGKAPTQTEAAAVMHVPLNTYQRWELGMRRISPPIALLARLVLGGEIDTG